MRHHNRNKKFGRKRNQRLALMRALSNSLFLHGKIQTTEAKAKAMRPFVERLITHAKTQSIPSRRLIAKRLGGNSQAGKLQKEAALRFASRNGGYTRITKSGTRKSDRARMAIIELITDST